MSKRVIEMVPVGELVRHPHNRVIDKEGADYLELLASVKAHGVRVPISYRMNGEVKEILAGEHRWTAAQEIGLDAVPCLLEEVSDAEAMAWVLVDNLKRSNLTPLQEAEGVAALMKVSDLDIEGVASRLNVAPRWVELRQGFLALPDEMRRGLNEKEGPDRLDIGVAALVVDTSPEDRERAVQLCFAPSPEDGKWVKVSTAKTLVEDKIWKPRKERQQWAGKRERRSNEARRLLGEVLEESAKPDCELVASSLETSVRSVEWDEWVSLSEGKGAESFVDVTAEVAQGLWSDMMIAEWPRKLMWLDLAERHGAQVLVVPPGEQAAEGREFRMVVDRRVLEDAEKGYSDAKLATWLQVGVRKKKIAKDEVVEPSDSGEESPESGVQNPEDEAAKKVTVPFDVDRLEAAWAAYESDGEVPAVQVYKEENGDLIVVTDTEWLVESVTLPSGASVKVFRKVG